MATRMRVLAFLLSAIFTGLWGIMSDVVADAPTVLSCFINASADRDYGFEEKAWTGPLNHPGVEGQFSAPFITGTPQKWNSLFIRDVVFSGLDSDQPIVRVITRSGAGDPFKEVDTVEWKAVILSRWGDTVFLGWTNPPGNKIWTAGVNRAHRKATVNYSYEGFTSFGVRIETFDCR